MKNAFYFTADWCNPCKKVRPIVDEINRESVKLKYQIIDADSSIELCKKFEIKSIPTFIIVEGGVIVKRMIGAQTKEALEEFISNE